MKPIMMKKWKWASIEPPEKPTSAAEQYTSPAVISREASRRWDTSRPAIRHRAGASSAVATVIALKPRHSPNRYNPTTCSSSTHCRKTWRRSHTW
jgi:hypothetical protein